MPSLPTACTGRCSSSHWVKTRYRSGSVRQKCDSSRINEIPSLWPMTTKRPTSVCIHAARAEMSGRTITEALACGTPVVATAVGGIPKQVSASSRSRTTHMWRPRSAALASSPTCQFTHAIRRAAKSVEDSVVDPDWVVDRQPAQPDEPRKISRRVLQVRISVIVTVRSRASAAPARSTSRSCKASTRAWTGSARRPGSATTCRPRRSCSRPLKASPRRSGSST